MHCGVWPLDTTKLLSQLRPVSADNLGEMNSGVKLEILFEQKRAAARNAVLGADGRMNSSGWLDKIEGAVLTAPQSLALARRKRAEDNRKRAEGEAKSLRAGKPATLKRAKVAG